MGITKKRINPKILNHVNRNFNQRYTKTVSKAVQQLPPPWKPCKIGRNGHEPQEVAAGCILKVGFNLTYDGIEAYLKESETFKTFFDDLLWTVQVSALVTAAYGMTSESNEKTNERTASNSTSALI